MGVSDWVINNKNRKIGHCGFHEIDNDGEMINIYTLREITAILSQRLNCSIYVFATAYGYHFVSFEIFDKKQFEKWKDLTSELLPSDYKPNIKHRILRISKKGKRQPPKFLFSINTYYNQYPQSKGHIEIYEKFNLIPKGVIRQVNLIETKPQLCIYKTDKLRKGD